MFDVAATALAHSLQAVAGVPVTVRRGAESISVTATRGASQLVVETGSGFAENIQATDFIILAADYVFGGAPAEPKRGDRIVESDTGREFEAMAPPGMQPFRYSDSGRALVRVHCQQVK